MHRHSQPRGETVTTTIIISILSTNTNTIPMQVISHFNFITKELTDMTDIFWRVLKHCKNTLKSMKKKTLTAWWRPWLASPLLLLSSGNSTSIKAQHVICLNSQPSGERFYQEGRPPRILMPLGRGGDNPSFAFLNGFWLFKDFERTRTLYVGSFALAWSPSQGGDMAVAAIYLQQHMLAGFLIFVQISAKD